MVVTYDPGQNLTVIASLPQLADAPFGQVNRDEAECELLSRVTDASGQRVDRDLFNRCMRSRGYVVQETK